MIVAIVCEYNPFHNGHLYQIEKIREEFGEDTTIIGIMSGNYVQRGGIAIADKGLRAKCAVLSGVNLILELPFPFSMSSAEFFARSAVRIADSLGCVDYLSFGSENGDIDLITKVACAAYKTEYDNIIKELSASDEYKKYGYPELCEIALKEVLKEENISFELTPNNILALEYVKSIIEIKSSIKPHTIKRCGGAFNEEKIVDGKFQSATAIRNSIREKNISALEYIPDITKNIYLEAIKHGEFPCDEEKLATAVLTHLRLNLPLAKEEIHDAKGGLYNRLRSKSYEANTIENLVSLSETKAFTKSRIRRAIFNCLLSVTSSQVKELPLYTQILALDAKGRAALKAIRKQSDFPILTKPSDTDVLSEAAKRQKVKSDEADSVFQLAKPQPPCGNYSIKFTPFVKE